MSGWLASLGLQRKLLLSIVIGVLLSLVVAGSAVLIYETSSFRPRMEAQLQAAAQVMADVNQAALQFDDAHLAKENLGFLRLYDGVDGGAIYHPDGSEFAHWTTGPQAHHPDKVPPDGFQHSASHASLCVPVLRDGVELGRLWVRVALPPLIKRMPQYGIMFGALALAVLVLGLVLLRASDYVVARPLAGLSRVVREVGRTGDYTVRVPKRAQDEVGQLSDEFNRMLGIIGERDAAVQQAHDELELRVQARSRELEQAMSLLMQREKMAALGNVVAGVAHELNTPIGNALLAASNLGKECQLMREQIGGSSLSRRDLEDFIESVDEGSGIVARSLDRAANLVRSFKSVAVNETSEARIVFDLRDTLQDCLSLLMPGLKHRPVALHLDCPAGIECDSFPGALTQIVTNLVENAARHGVEPKGGGNVRVEVEATPDAVLIKVLDDGMGIPAENLRHVFEPFFTTRLGQGGSGLGLHVVYGLASGPLGGSIHVHSDPGRGSCFELRFPRQAPRQTAASSAALMASGPATRPGTG